MDIIEFYKKYKVDENFNEVFYEQQCPNVVDFYEPYASEMGLTKKEKYFFHYHMYGKGLSLLPADKTVETSISLLIACKNREENLHKIIQSWHSVDLIKEIIVVDYSSDNKIEINEYENVKVIRVENEPFFNLGKAYNLAFDLSSCEFVIKIDCDYLLVNDSFIERFFKNVNAYNYFIRGDYLFSRYTSGFFVIHRDKFPYFREDLIGYGYDEVDLYNRINEIHPDIKELIIFDIDEYIYHIPHHHEKRSDCYSNKDISQSEANNRSMCEIFSPHVPVRSKYTINNNAVSYQQDQIDRIFCINLDDRSDRWDNINQKHLIERFSAIDTRDGLVTAQHFGLNVNPCNLSAKAYLNYCKGSIGAYLSHYKLWKKIVEEEISHALIIEDDVDSDTVTQVANSNLIISNYDIINLSKRLSWDSSHNRILFDGAEAYMLSFQGAKKLINATKFPILLSYVIPQCYHSLDNMELHNFNNPSSIVAPVDKFMGYCCEEKADHSIKLNYYIYPIVDINQEYTSDIDKAGKKVWDMNTSEIKAILHEN